MRRYIEKALDRQAAGTALPFVIVLQAAGQAEAIGGDRYSAQNQDDFSFVGTPQQIIEQMQPFIALGVDSFLLDCGGFPNLTTLELLIHEVLPAVTQATA